MAARSKYRPHFPELVTWMARNGLTAVEIARELGVNKDTLYKWRAAHPDLAEAMDEGRDLADARVVNSLYERANGIQWDEKTYEAVRNPKTKQYELVCMKVVTKFIPPDPTSISTWLNNRRPDEWCNRRRIEHTGADGKPIEVRGARESLVGEVEAFLREQVQPVEG